MIDPTEAKKIVQDKLSEISNEELQNSIESTDSEVSYHLEESGQLNLFSTVDTPLPLQAYLACALTGLDFDRRSLIFQLSDVTSQICEKHGISLYEPRKKTDPVHHPTVEDIDVFNTDRERVLNSDLLIYLSLFPSTGAGQELDFAYNALLPIIIISRNKDKVSRMVTGIPAFKVHIKYDEPEELRDRLDDCLTQIKPIIEERKLVFSEYKTNIVGQRIRTLREQLGLTRSEITSIIKTLTEAELTKLEESPDIISNPTLTELRQLAVILKTTVSELVEPDMGPRLLKFINDILDGRLAARYSSITEHDTKKIMRRTLLRIIDKLERE